MNVWEIYQNKTKNNNYIDIAMLTLNTTFKARKIIGTKERFFNLTIRSVHQEITNPHLYSHNNIGSYYVKQKRMEIKKK